MGRFSSWAQGQRDENSEVVFEPKATTVEEKVTFVVENHELRSHSQGIRYRCSQDMKDKHSKVALFGSKVKGVPQDGWVKVGPRYLPTHIGNACVLRAIDSTPVKVEEFEVEADKQLGDMLFGKNGYNNIEASTADSPNPLIRPETSAPGAEPLLPIGFGALYEVVYDRVAIRSAPLVTATTVEVKEKGDALELFGWDKSKQWRRCPADMLGTTAGWVMLDHRDFGPLVRPQGAPLCARPLEPLCVAAAEDQLLELRRFLEEGHNPSACDAGGTSALTLASRADARDCLVYLIEAGAAATAEESQAALEAAASAGTKSLIEALTGHRISDDTALQEALADLTADARIVVDRIQEQLEDTLARERDQEKLRAPEPVAPEPVPVEVKDTAPRTAPKPVKLQRKGGVLHEVMHKAVAIRYLPSTTADMVGTRILGQFVELFEESGDKKWRKMEDAESGEEGWMLLQHPQIGSLLRPVSEERLE